MGPRQRFASSHRIRDGVRAPDLERDQPMLFEQVARRLVNLEELEYSLAIDEEPYEAAAQSRFRVPEIVTAPTDVIRRLELLKGTRAAIGRRGFGADLQILADASAVDFMKALNIAKPAPQDVATQHFRCAWHRGGGKPHCASAGTSTTSNSAPPASSPRQTSRTRAA